MAKRTGKRSSKRSSKKATNSNSARKQLAIKAIEIKFEDDDVTSFGGLALTERLALATGLWSFLLRRLPERGGTFSWIDTIRSAVTGALSGLRGTVACDGARNDKALRKLIAVDAAPEEATFWRDLARLGAGELDALLADAQRVLARRVLASTKKSALLRYGFLPLFGDGTMLEGSKKREGTKWPKDKKPGLILSTWFVGPILAAQRLAGKGEGEQSSLRASLDGVLEEVVDRLNLRRLALVLMDSLHGDGPTLSAFESRNANYIVGANKLAETKRVLADRCEIEWSERGAQPHLGWSESAVCVCSIQCEGWAEKRLLVGRRWLREGELPGMPYQYSGVMTTLREADVAHMTGKSRSFADAIWKLYDMKAGYEDHFKDLLDDLAGHRPPCQELARNRGYYSLLALSHTLARGVDLIGLHDERRGSRVRVDGGERRRPLPRRRRIWRLRRELFNVPARIVSHGRTASVSFLGVSGEIRSTLAQIFARLGQCFNSC